MVTARRNSRGAVLITGWVEPIARQSGTRYRGVAWDAAAGRRCRPEGSKVFDTHEAAAAWWQARERRCDNTYASVGEVPWW